MAFTIGSLVIEMQANVARLSKDMAESKAVVNGAMGDIKTAVGKIAIIRKARRLLRSYQPTPFCP